MLSEGHRPMGDVFLKVESALVLLNAPSERDRAQ